MVGRPRRVVRVRPCEDNGQFHFGKCFIGRPSVGMNRRCLWHDRPLNKGGQYGGRCPGNHGETNTTGRAAAALDRNGHPDLARSTSVPSFAVAAPERAPSGLLVRTPTIGGAENAACFSYSHFD